MGEGAERELEGGNMSSVFRVGDTVRRSSTAGSDTIQAFVSHLRSQGVSWVPQPLGFDEENREVWSFIEGECVDGEFPAWFWDESLLETIATRLRQLHDASERFPPDGAIWNWAAMEPQEVILHRDFAPYNCLFRGEEFVGLVDFDLCAPGPRLWDIAYTAYRFVPVMPSSHLQLSEPWTLSPFSFDQVRERVQKFVEAYGHPYSVEEVLWVIGERLEAMIDWIEGWLKSNPNSGLEQNLVTYRIHREWIGEVLKS